MTSTAALVVAEIRRQVDHQLTAATAADTKAAGLIAGTFALTALVIPRVRPDEAGLAGVVTLALVVITLVLFALAIRPRVGGFSYGPDPMVMQTFVTDDDPPEELERALAAAYVKVRNANEATIQAKADALIAGIVTLILTVVSLGVMLAMGGIQ